MLEEKTTDISLKDLSVKLEEFAKARDWEKYHTPRNLLLAMVISACIYVSNADSFIHASFANLANPLLQEYSYLFLGLIHSKVSSVQFDQRPLKRGTLSFECGKYIYLKCYFALERIRAIMIP